jgi:hypothetical protein
MDFDGFLVQMRIELDGVERVAAPLWALAVPTATQEALGDNGTVPATDERCH